MNSEQKDIRDRFKKYFDGAINDILVLNDCNLSVKQINEITEYQIDFIVYVLSMYQLNKSKNTKSIKITSHNINVDELKKLGYHDALINDMIDVKNNDKYYKEL